MLAVRHRLTGLLFCGTVINYIDRVNISIAAPVMLRELGWSKVEMGWVFSAFLIGNALLQLPGGVLADRWSARRVLAVAFCGFSLFTLLTPLGARVFTVLLALRFLVGLFESLTFPAVISINTRWIPRSEFGWAHTLSVSGVTVGQVVAYPLTTWIVLSSSWEMVFYVNAALGFAWAAAWLRFARDTPAEHPGISADERAHIESDPLSVPSRPVALRTIFATPSLLALALAFMCFAYVAWLVLFWLPTYLTEARGLEMRSMAAGGVAVLGAAFAGLVGGGALADVLIREGMSAQFARARFPGMCILSSLAFLVMTPLVESALASIACLVVFAMLFNGGLAGFSTIAVEFDPRQAGAIFGAINMCAAFAAVFGPLTAGYVLHESGGNWVLPFAVSTCVAAVSGAILLMVRVRRIE
jgi:MFS family permease